MDKVQILNEWLTANHVRLTWRNDLSLNEDNTITGKFFCSLEAKACREDVEFKVGSCLVSKSGIGPTAIAAMHALIEYIEAMEPGSICVYYTGGKRIETMLPIFK